MPALVDQYSGLVNQYRASVVDVTLCFAQQGNSASQVACPAGASHSRMQGTRVPMLLLSLFLWVTGYRTLVGIERGRDPD